MDPYSCPSYHTPCQVVSFSEKLGGEQQEVGGREGGKHATFVQIQALPSLIACVFRAFLSQVSSGSCSESPPRQMKHNGYELQRILRKIPELKSAKISFSSTSGGDWKNQAK